MLKSLALLCLLGLVGVASASPNADWQASVELAPVGDSSSVLPQVVVPKQSLLMNVTMWMPDKVNWYPQFPQWDMPGATIVPLMMLSPTVERDTGKFLQKGATQNYLLTPMEEGSLQLSPGTIMVYPGQDDSPRIPIDALQLQVVLPEGAGTLDQFLPASALTVTQQFYRLLADGTQEQVPEQALDHTRLQAGQLLERRITLEAQGIQGNQIINLQPDRDVVQHEAQTADLNNYGDFTGGTRTERWFYAPQDKDSITLEPIVVRWYRLGTRQFETATLAGGRVQVEVAKQIDSRIRLSWWERLSLLPTNVGIAALIAVVLLALGAYFRRAIVDCLQEWARRVYQFSAGSEYCWFLSMCGQIGVFGLASARAQRAFQHWLIRAGATQQVEDAKAVQAWGRARYAAAPTRTPRRLQVLCELLAVRWRIKAKKCGAVVEHHALPALRKTSL